MTQNLHLRLKALTEPPLKQCQRVMDTFNRNLQFMQEFQHKFQRIPLNTDSAAVPLILMSNRFH